MNKAHIHGLSSYICCALIYLKRNDKSIDFYILLLNLNDMIRQRSRGYERKHVYVMHYPMCFLHAQFKGNENKHIHMSFYHQCEDITNSKLYDKLPI